MKGGKKCTIAYFLCRLKSLFQVFICVIAKKLFTLQTFLRKNKFNSNIKITIMSDIESKVKAIIVDKLGVDEADVKPEASFTNDLGADSLDTVELIMEFEKEFGISIPDDKAETIQTVQDAINYINENAK